MTDTSSCPHATLVVPALNESAHLRESLTRLVDYLDGQPWEGELIVVDDGSTDGTAEAAREVGGPVRVLSQHTNLGKGAAVRRGMLAARGRFCVFTDADVPYGVGGVARAIKALETDGADVVIGDRTLPGASYHGRISLSRRLASSAYARLVGWILTLPTHDTQCGLKGFRCDVARRLFSRCVVDGFGFDVEVVYASVLAELKITRIPVVLECDLGRSVRLRHHAATMLLDVLRVRKAARRGHYDGL